MEEIWKDIEGYEGLYQVSSFGNIKRLNRYRSDGIFLKEKLLALNVSGDGYIIIGLMKDGVRKFYYVHRLVAKHFIKNENPKAIVVDHIDTNRINNHVEILRWCTHSENNLNPITRLRMGRKKKQQ